MTSDEGAKDSIDVQFDRAVEIVQGLPKTGPIQTDYEEKLVMYSLYKQATVGNVRSPRPGIWDMLGRAKWDAWAKHKDLDSPEAKRLYIEALLKVLRRYSDKTVAKSLVDELESYQGGPSKILRSRNNGRTSDSNSSGTSVSTGSPRSQYSRETLLNRQDADNENDLEEERGEPGDLPNTNTMPSVSHLGRPTSSMSSNRYRTPLAGSHITSPPPSQSIPNLQPRPSFETPSAFADPRYSRSPPGSTLFQSSYTGQYEEPIHSGLITPPITTYPPPQHRENPQLLPRLRGGQQVSRITLERAVEHLQTQVAALQERLETLEASRYLSKSLTLPASRGSSPNGGRGLQWDINDLGLWSVVLNPLINSIDTVRSMARFLARDENRSPLAAILRRLCLDFSFLLCAIAITRFVWKGSSARRREVRVALKILWRALLGTKPQNVLVGEGV
ncbi:hypothetical protein M378DRAFT_72566 [Amanita muscaria Koide BX008]|uniref:ACB domain-containing protein n=1 Tax=Amanita muscaria (strain Koide BX008) TaxID=946122 RepID=A0A0C2X273_AMAMK|nr:hypothetical protein M378DRAFT_72566 [Amanita muscaria Koide BX008]